MAAIVVFLAGTGWCAPGAAQQPPSAAGGDPAAQGTFERVVARFRARRVPPFVRFTLVRYQLMTTGELDPTNSYMKRAWARTSDNAALVRWKLTTSDTTAVRFEQFGFNGRMDPGPPTFDVFEGVDASSYAVDSAVVEGSVVHVRLHAARDPERFRLRDVFADTATYDVRTLVAGDTLFDGAARYPVTMTITMANVEGVPVLVDVHGDVGGGYAGDGQTVDYRFSEIAFPSTLPDWYFDPKAYDANRRHAPE